jgi:hypothetical protein
MALEWLWLLLPIVLVILVILGDRRRRRGNGPTIARGDHSWYSGSGNLP